MTVMLDAYKEGRIDRLFLVHNVFVNTMSQKPEIATLLPAEPLNAQTLPKHWDYLYEPGAVELLDDVLTRYIETQVYRARRGERGLRDGVEDGRHEGGNRQRGQDHREAAARLQQGAAGEHHAGDRGDRRRRRRRLEH